MGYGDKGRGGQVTVDQCSGAVRVQTASTVEVDLSSAEASQGIPIPDLFNAEADVLVFDCNFIYTETPAASSTINVGTLADPNALIAGFSTDDGSAGGTNAVAKVIGESESLNASFATTLMNTLEEDSMKARRLPRIPKGTPLFVQNSASGGAGQGFFVFSYFVKEPRN